MDHVKKNRPQPSIRRLFQFSLKSALVLMTILCIGLGTWTYRSKRQMLAVEAITDVGGEFCYSYQVVDPNSVPAPPSSGGRIGNTYSFQVEPATPSWLRNLIGDHYFITPVRLLIRKQGQIDHNCLAHLKALPHLEEMWFYDVELDDVDLANLKHLRKLKMLTFGDGTLSRSDPPRNFDFLRRLRKLESLTLSDSEFGDRDAANIAQASTLKYLYLYDSAIGDGGMAQIRRLTNLESLGLNGTNVTDTGIAHICCLQKLQYLALSDCKITDAAIQHLSIMNGLRRVELYRTKVTEKGFSDLRQALPGCEVMGKPSVDAGDL
jgi:hypothetical protein